VRAHHIIDDRSAMRVVATRRLFAIGATIASRRQSIQVFVSASRARHA